MRSSVGAALLVAMLTVSLVATLSSAALALQWRAYEVERAERARQQAAWLLRGAIDWARLVLREDARSGGIDHLGEPWAIPLKEAKLSGFLATPESDRDSLAGGALDDVFLSGEIIDLQSRLNITNLIAADGRISEPDHKAFRRLFAYLNLPVSELDRAADRLVAARGRVDGAPEVALLPQRLEQLGWIGISPESVAALRPFVAVLPTRTALNLNTASPEAMYAAIEGINLGDANRLAALRLEAPFATLGEATKALGPVGEGLKQSNSALSVATQYFQISARVQMEDALIEQRWVVQRTISRVELLWML